MAKYKVVASVTSPPFDIWLNISGHDIPMRRDSTGAWAGEEPQMDLSSPAPIQFRAVGVSSAAWTLTVTFTPLSGGAPRSYTHADVIPDSLLSILSDHADLT